MLTRFNTNSLHYINSNYATLTQPSAGLEILENLQKTRNNVYCNFKSINADVSYTYVKISYNITVFFAQNF
jgi:hypothetical protein